MSTWPSELTVVVADDDDEVRAALRALLDGTPGISVVAEASDGDAAVRACAHHDPHVAVLDVRMPGDGLAAAREILATMSGTRIVLLTADDDPTTRSAAAEAGVAGFVLKSSNDDLTGAVRRAAST